MLEIWERKIAKLFFRKRLSPHFASNIKRIQTNLFRSVPIEIIRFDEFRREKKLIHLNSRNIKSGICRRSLMKLIA